MIDLPGPPLRRGSQQERQTPSCLVQLQTGGGKTSVFCFLWAGGFKREFSRFAQLAPAVGRKYSFYGVIARGTDGVSPPHRSVKEMAADYIREIRTVQPNGPYFILGECFSAPVALETAEQLRAAGERIALLGFLDGRRRPDPLNRYLGKRITTRLHHHLFALSKTRTWSYFANDIPSHLQTLRGLDNVGRIRHFFRKLWGVIGRTVRARSSRKAPQPASARDREEMAKAGSLKRAEIAYSLAVRRHERRPYSGKMVVIANEEWRNADPTLGWIADGGLEVHGIPGDHDTYIRNHFEMVASLLRDHIERAEQEK